MNFLTWNCYDVGGLNFPSLVKDYVKMYNLDFLMLLKPRISGARDYDVIRKIGFPIALKLTLMASPVEFGVCGDLLVQTSQLSPNLNIVYILKLMM